MRFSLSSTFIFLALCSTAFGQLTDDNRIFRSYLSDAGPNIDGIIDLGEWDAAGPPIVVLPDSTDGVPTEGGTNINGSLPGDNYGGAEDFSFQFRSMWVAPWDIYFLVEITDDIAMDASHNLTDRAWERDQIEFFVDGDQLTGGNIRWWTEADTGPQETYGKFGVSRDGEFEGNVALMTTNPDDVGENGIAAAGIATETGENANYFVEYRVSMKPAFEDGLFEGSTAGDFGTMVPDLTAIKFQMAMSDNDNYGLPSDNPPGDGAVRSHGGAPWRAAIDANGCTQKISVTGESLELCGDDEWWRSDAYPNLLMADIYIPDVGGGPDCDFDGSGSCDIGDLNELMYTGLSSGDSKYDLDNSGAVDLADRDAFLVEINSLPGDANGDGIVNAQDLNAVGSNWQMTGVTSYAEGDFNGDGMTDATDLNEVGLWWTKSAADFSGGAQAAAPAAVPEPASSTLLMFLSLGVLALRKK